MKHPSNNFSLSSSSGTSSGNTSASDRSALKRAAIEEAISIAKMRRVEREIDDSGTRSGYPLRGRKQYLTATASRRAQAQWGVPFIYKSRAAYRGSDGRRSFHVGFVGIPKTSRTRRLPKGTMIHPGAAEGAARYIAEHDRPGYLMGDRVQCKPSGEPDFDSNISDSSLEDVFDFFALVEKHERNASPDQATIDFARHRSLWRRIVDDAECDPAVIDAYRKDPDGQAAKVSLRGEALALKKVMLRHGFQKARPDDDLPEEVLTDHARLDDVEWKIGRGGRTQHRLTIALPHEFDAEQRRGALGAVCAELKRLKVMYFGVIHEPTATNDERNYHIHLDIYDRPCRRLTGTAADLIDRPGDHHELVPGEVDEGQFVDRKGEWDFAVEREYTSGSRNKRKHYPFRANKVREVNHRDFPSKLRRIVEQEVNSIAAGAGMKPLYDARTYEKMGIDKEPDEPLGAREHALVMRGIVTDKALRNEQRHNDAQHRHFGRNFHRRMAEIERHEQRLELIFQSTKDLPKDPGDQREIAEARAEIETLRAAAAARRELDLLALAMDRSLSSEAAVSDRAVRVIEAGGDRSGEYAGRLAEGRRWFSETHSGDNNLAHIIHDLTTVYSSGKATERALDTRLEMLRQSIAARALNAPSENGLVVGEAPPASGKGLPIGTGEKIPSWTAEASSGAVPVTRGGSGAFQQEQISRDQDRHSDTNTDASAIAEAVKPTFEGRAAASARLHSEGETPLSAAVPSAEQRIAGDHQHQCGKQTTTPVLVDGKDKPSAETVTASEGNKVPSARSGMNSSEARPARVSDTEGPSHAAHPPAPDETAEIPVKEMFNYIYARSWRLDYEGPHENGDIVFAEPHKVPPSFQHWLANHQNFAPWFYSTQQHLLNPPAEKAKAPIEVVSSPTNVAHAHRQAAIDASRRGIGVG